MTDPKGHGSPSPGPKGPGGARHPDLVSRASPAVIICVAAALLVGAVILVLELTGGGPTVPEDYRYESERLTAIDPSLVGFEPAGRIDLPGRVTCLAVGPRDEIHVGGADGVAVLDAEGQKIRAIECEKPPSCLAVAEDGTLYVGLVDHIDVHDPNGRRTAEWPSAGENALLTSIAVGEKTIYAADARNRTVWRYSRDGRVEGRIGDRDPDRNVPGLIVPSPYLDVAIAPDGLLRLVNPGRHRIEAYTPGGAMEIAWGKASFKIEGFTGCCNPAHFTILRDGRFVTSEKGASRVKLHDIDGEFLCVVAGPEQLGRDKNARDVAVDSRGRVLVLDPATSSVRVFTEKPERAGTEGSAAEDGAEEDS